ncbi:hypothetical protein BGZ57DRAFT_214131 [Hyaloscypha finlandica]|nr:hypothetical protein BGZ57DRAFT_214131 [Hyaloscypha finlandica]
MKAGLFLLLALGASSTLACSNYAVCYCQTSDGKFDNTATKTVCDGYGKERGQLVYATIHYGDDTNNQECLEVHSRWNNCEWRRRCTDAGATGSDSQCWCKGDCKYNPPYERPV